jgi:hypothetical protein
MCAGLGGRPYHEGWSELQGTFRLGLYIDIRAWICKRDDPSELN